MVPVCRSGAQWLRNRLPCIAAIAALALLAGSLPAFAHGMMPDRSYLENGALHGLTAIEIMLPGIAIGIALAQVQSWTMALAVVLFSMLTAVGAWLGERNTVEILPFLNPGLVMLAGGLMLSVGPALRYSLFPAMTMLGLLYGAAFFIDGPGDNDWPWFAAGVFWAAAAAAIASTALWSWVQARWSLARWPVIAARICGSWLVAIGIIMLALGLKNLGAGTSI